MSDPSLLGLGTPFIFEGVSYLFLSPRPFEVEGEFIVWVQQEAYKALLPHEKILGPVRFAQQLEGWRHDLGSRVYAWGKPACDEALRSPDGVKEMAWFQFAAGEARLVEAGRPPKARMARETIEKIMADPVKGEELVCLVLGIKQDPKQDPARPNASSPSPTPSAE